MRHEQGRGKSGGVSLRSDDAIDVGLFSSGPAVIKESIFADFTYKGQSRPVPTWLITYSREGEQDYEQPYGIGKGWKISDDGTALIPKAGQTGLPKTCNAMLYLVKPLEKALTDAGLDADQYLGTGDPTALVGLEVVVARITQMKREGLPSRGRKHDEDGKSDERTILQIEEVTAAADNAPKGKGKGKKAAPVDDEDEDEAPAKGKGKSGANGGKGKADADADDEDEDEDEDDDDEAEPPARHAKGGKVNGTGKSGGKANGKGKADADDDDNDLLEEGVEALIAALEEQNGPIKVAALADALDTQLKGNPSRKSIIKLMADPETLELEKGWAFNAKKSTVTLDLD